MALSGKTCHSSSQLSFLLMGSLVESSKHEEEEDGVIWAVMKLEVGSVFTTLGQSTLWTKGVHSQ